ncbi:Rpn family recombination-promoting nuclease/putative transposase [uncultured Lamprocystis sp.]|jgi:hypothetical protein|uniref:Rpn family recombination-promoting nuclease/putative transposase n=1 Tax=uncultured Lamprocystis sp. TaxID=543132 RepID=UPI0025D74E90|nr:Rpn family recombination-promoting nuclease/putative transposase [uncultured Lamprocystis sp.]
MTKRHPRQRRRRPRAPGHDSGYKLLYSHVAMVRDLLRHVVPGDWIDQLDLGSLEKCSGSYVSDDLRDRSDDLIWRVRWGPDWLYLYLLLEFQSTIDAWMAVRIQTYVGLLYQDLIRTGQLTAAGQLPPVLPLVLYNGIKPWDAARDLDALIAPGPAILRDYRPRQGYSLLDEIRIADAGGLPERNLSAALFRLEASRTPAEVLGILQALVGWLQAPEQTSLRRAFAVWISRVFLPRRLPGVAIDSMNDLHEVRSMLAERYETWTEQWKREGLEQGLEKGREEGREEGLEEGLEKGRQEGEAAMLQRLLTLKFGPPDAGVRQRIATADAATLLRWSERVLTAQRLGEVLDEARDE